MSEIWHVADDEGNPQCGAEGDMALSDPENIADADRRGILCQECEG